MNLKRIGISLRVSVALIISILVLNPALWSQTNDEQEQVLTTEEFRPSLTVYGETTQKLVSTTASFNLTDSSGNSLFFVGSNGNIGIGTIQPKARLSVNGMIETMAGGVRFPDGTIQTTAWGGGNELEHSPLPPSNFIYYWGLGGNYLTGQDHFLGTVNGFDLIFRTNNLPRMYISKSGPVVFIGHSYPNNGTGIVLGRDGSSGPYKMEIRGGRPYIDFDDDNPADDYDMRIVLPSNYNIVNNTAFNGTTYPQVKALSIMPGLNSMGGNVGIGTTTPNDALHIVDNNAVEQWGGGPGIIFGKDTNFNYKMEIRGQQNPLNPTIRTTPYIDIANDIDDDLDGFDDDYDVRLILQNQNDLTIESEGGRNARVGIEERNPQTSLDVNGQARIQNLSIDNTLTNIVVADASGVLHINPNLSVSTPDQDWLPTTAGNTGDIYHIGGNIGIGRNDPKANTKLHVSNGNVLFDGSSANAWAAVSPGVQLMWVSGAGAFRAGEVTGSQWDAVGANSFAVGYNTVANQAYSFASGYGSQATAMFASSMGRETIASGDASTSLGYQTIASGEKSIAMGYQTRATGPFSAALGFQTEASGEKSIAMGDNVWTAGKNHIVIGWMARTLGGEGSFIYGDHQNIYTPIEPSADNQFIVRAAGGIWLGATGGGPVNFDPDAFIQTSTGAKLTKSGVWQNTCDKNKKENFESIDTDLILSKLSQLQIYKWNYKVDNYNIKHIGPTAQDFYATFGLGNDEKTLSTIDPAGVALVAIQALEKRTAELKQTQLTLQEKIDKLEKLEAELARLKAENGSMKTRMENMETTMQNIERMLAAKVAENGAAMTQNK